MEGGGRLCVWYCTPGLRSVVAEGKGLGVEPEIVILLNGHVVKLSSKYLCLHLQSWNIFRLTQGSLFLWGRSATGETRSWSKY